MTTADKITKAKISLLIGKPAQPFFASLLMGMNVKEDTTVSKAATDGLTIKLNPEYIDKLSIEELKGLICTGVMETALLHPTRRNGRDAGNWSKSCQLAANQLVLQSGLKLPKDALINDQFNGMAAEQIYKLMPAPTPDEDGQDGEADPDGTQAGDDSGDTQGDGQPGDEDGPEQDNGPMEVQDTPAQTETEKQAQEAKTKQKVAQATLAAERAGNLPGFLKAIIEDILAARINWKEIINRFVVDISRNDYSFSRPNTRFLHTGFILPSLYNIEPNNLIFLNDCSGSMKKTICLKVGGEVTDAAQQINAGLTLINVNTEVVGEPIQIEQGEKIPFMIEPDGGTKFSPGFDYIEEKGLPVTAVIYLTDGDCEEFPKNEPDYPVLWIVYDRKHFTPPFGEVIHVSEED